MIPNGSRSAQCAFQHFVDVSGSEANPHELESRRKLIERLNSIDPEKARIQVLMKKKYPIVKSQLLASIPRRVRRKAR